MSIKIQRNTIPLGWIWYPVNPSISTIHSLNCNSSWFHQYQILLDFRFFTISIILIYPIYVIHFVLSISNYKPDVIYVSRSSITLISNAANIINIDIFYVWLVVSILVSWDDDIPNIWGKKKMFQTTNQMFYVLFKPCISHSFRILHSKNLAPSASPASSAPRLWDVRSAGSRTKRQRLPRCLTSGMITTRKRVISTMKIRI